MSLSSPEDEADVEETRRRVYERLKNVADEDAVHDLIARHGPQFLDRDLPFLIVAARNQLRSRLRRAHREHLALQMPDLADPSGDAYDAATGRIGVDALLSALARLDPRDTLLLWRFAEGVPDKEIAAEWEARQLKPSNPSAAALRKRRERAREKLRSMLDSSANTNDG
jgi:DNA-directed RNA polymerase specialized sigma24 family protein